MEPLPPFATHRVDNQPPPFAPRDLWADDVALRQAVAREGGPGSDPAAARSFVESLALALQASVLLRAESPVADAFCRSRLGGAHGPAVGTLPPDAPLEQLIWRAIGSREWPGEATSKAAISPSPAASRGR